MAKWLAVFFGGALGGLGRFAIAQLLPGAHGLLATTSVNLIGSFLLALLTFGLSAHWDLPDWLSLGLGTGMIGAFTTWSSLASAVVTAQALVWLLVNLSLGMLAAALGFVVADRRWAR